MGLGGGKPPSLLPWSDIPDATPQRRTPKQLQPTAFHTAGF